MKFRQKLLGLLGPISGFRRRFRASPGHGMRRGAGDTERVESEDRRHLIGEVMAGFGLGSKKHLGHGGREARIVRRLLRRSGHDELLAFLLDQDLGRLDHRGGQHFDVHFPFDWGLAGGSRVGVVVSRRTDAENGV